MAEGKHSNPVNLDSDGDENPYKDQLLTSKMDKFAFKSQNGMGGFHGVGAKIRLTPKTNTTTPNTSSVSQSPSSGLLYQKS